MLVAIFAIHGKFGYSSVNTIGLTEEGPVFGPPGYEINLLYIAGLLNLLLTGSGVLSLDALWVRAKRRNLEREHSGISLNEGGDRKGATFIFSGKRLAVRIQLQIFFSALFHVHFTFYSFILWLSATVVMCCILPCR